MQRKKKKAPQAPAQDPDIKLLDDAISALPTSSREADAAAATKENHPKRHSTLSKQLSFMRKNRQWSTQEARAQWDSRESKRRLRELEDRHSSMQSEWNHVSSQRAEMHARERAILGYDVKMLRLGVKQRARQLISFMRNFKQTYFDDLEMLLQSLHRINLSRPLGDTSEPARDQARPKSQAGLQVKTAVAGPSCASNLSSDEDGCSFEKLLPAAAEGAAQLHESSGTTTSCHASRCSANGYHDGPGLGCSSQLHCKHEASESHQQPSPADCSCVAERRHDGHDLSFSSQLLADYGVDESAEQQQQQLLKSQQAGGELAAHAPSTRRDASAGALPAQELQLDCSGQVDLRLQLLRDQRHREIEAWRKTEFDMNLILARLDEDVADVCLQCDKFEAELASAASSSSAADAQTGAHLASEPILDLQLRFMAARDQGERNLAFLERAAMHIVELPPKYSACSMYDGSRVAEASTAFPDSNFSNEVLELLDVSSDDCDLLLDSAAASIVRPEEEIPGHASVRLLGTASSDNSHASAVKLLDLDFKSKSSQEASAKGDVVEAAISGVSPARGPSSEAAAAAEVPGASSSVAPFERGYLGSRGSKRPPSEAAAEAEVAGVSMAVALPVAASMIRRGSRQTQSVLLPMFFSAKNGPDAWTGSIPQAAAAMNDPGLLQLHDWAQREEIEAQRLMNVELSTKRVSDELWEFLWTDLQEKRWKDMISDFVDMFAEWVIDKQLLSPHAAIICLVEFGKRVQQVMDIYDERKVLLSKLADEKLKRPAA